MLDVYLLAKADFTMYRRKFLPVLILGSLTLPACHADSSAKPTAVDTLVKKTLSHMSFVQGGSFQMGDFGPIHSEEQLPYTDLQSGEWPLHKVTLDSFSMMQYKVTNADFDVYTATNGLPAIDHYFNSTDSPANVNWPQARDYCHWLGRLTQLPFDLPTEAQWEYAARNRGQFVLFATDNGKLEPERNVGTFELANAPIYPIGHFPPSPLGFYDMGVNGQEWMLDWYAKDYYERSPEHNPTGPSSGTEKILRGAPGTATPQAPALELNMWRSHRPPVTREITDEDGTGIVQANGRVRCVVNEDAVIRP